MGVRHWYFEPFRKPKPRVFTFISIIFIKCFPLFVFILSNLIKIRSDVQCDRKALQSEPNNQLRDKRNQKTSGIFFGHQRKEKKSKKKKFK